MLSEADTDLGADGREHFDVFIVLEIAVDFINDLNDAEEFLLDIEDGHGEAGLGFEACFFIEGRVEEGVLIDVFDVERLLFKGDGTSDTLTEFEANDSGFFCDDGVEALFTFSIDLDEEDGSAFAAHELGCAIADNFEDDFDASFGSDALESDELVFKSGEFFGIASGVKSKPGVIMRDGGDFLRFQMRRHGQKRARAWKGIKKPP